MPSKFKPSDEIWKNLFIIPQSFFESIDLCSIVLDSRRS